MHSIFLRLWMPPRKREASHGGKHCDSLGEDQICCRSEFARAEGMVVARQASKLEVSREKPSTGRYENFLEQSQ